jgi:hypothetical protein
VDRLSAFFDLIQQDPIVSQVKLIAEPWDIGDGGYQVGNFPPVWTEWNGTFRDTVRDFWRGEPATLADFTSRRRTDVRRAMERRPRPHRDDVPQRRRDHRTRPARPTHRRRLVPGAVQRPPRTAAFTTPDAGYGKEWVTEIDTAQPTQRDDAMLVAGDSVELPGRSITVLRRRT